MDPIHAIFENGTVRLLEPAPWPEQTRVIVQPETSPPAELGSNSPELYEILSRRYNSGVSDTAARVDELDP